MALGGVLCRRATKRPPRPPPPPPPRGMPVTALTSCLCLVLCHPSREARQNGRADEGMRLCLQGKERMSLPGLAGHRPEAPSRTAWRGAGPQPLSHAPPGGPREPFRVPKSYYCVFSGSLYRVCPSALPPTSCSTGTNLYHVGILLPF